MANVGQTQRFEVPEMMKFVAPPQEGEQIIINPNSGVGAGVNAAENRNSRIPSQRGEGLIP